MEAFCDIFQLPEEMQNRTAANTRWELVQGLARLETYRSINSKSIALDYDRHSVDILSYYRCGCYFFTRRGL